MDGRGDDFDVCPIAPGAFARTHFVRTSWKDFALTGWVHRPKQSM
jgi:hypothetical protein